MAVKLLHIIQNQFNIQVVESPVPLVTPVVQPIAPYRRAAIEWGLERVTPNSNERTRCESIVGSLMFDVAVKAEVSLFIGNPFEVAPRWGLVGICDYLMSRSPLTFRIHPPVTLIVEVKRNLERALPHCLLEMIAAQRLNATSDPIYGAVTDGLNWKFLKLEGNIATLEQTCYDLEPMERISSILTAMAA